MRQSAPRDFDRSLRLLERTLDGATLPECAAEFGLSVVRVRQLIGGITRILLSPQRLRGEKPPHHNYGSYSARREHAEFWRRQAAKARRPATMAALEILDSSADLQHAFSEALHLLNYYGSLLNRRDCGARRAFSVESWLALCEQLQNIRESEVGIPTIKHSWLRLQGKNAREDAA